MTTLRLLDDMVELDGRPVAQLLPGVCAVSPGQAGGGVRRPRRGRGRPSPPRGPHRAAGKPLGRPRAGRAVVKGLASTRGSGPGRPSGASGVGGCPPRPKRASWGLLAALAAGALMLAGPAFADSTIVPDPTITPGAVRTTDVGEICSTGTRQLRHWDRARDDRIMAEYGLPAGPHPGLRDRSPDPARDRRRRRRANLWPEPRRSIEPIWNAEAKDRLEWRMRELICAGQLDVRRGPAHDGGGLGRRVRAILSRGDGTEMNDLVRYEAARRALAEAHRIDEVKDVRDKMEAMQKYAKMANDTQLLQHATDIRLRAERRWGELYRAQEKARPRGSNQHEDRSRATSDPPTLKAMGVTFTQSSKWQKLATLPEDKFEIRVAHAKARVEGMTTSAPNDFERRIYRRKRMVHTSGIRREGARDSRSDRSGPRVARPCPEDSARHRVLHRRRERTHSAMVWSSMAKPALQPRTDVAIRRQVPVGIRARRD